MKKEKMNINKTKYRFLMDNLNVFPIRPIMIYTIPVPNDPTVDESNQEFFDRTYPDVEITNLHFKHMIEDTAKALVAYGVKKGDIVTICHTNTPEILYMDYALSKIGAIPNYIYPNVTAEEMKYYMEELDSKYMFILDDKPIKENVKIATKDMDVKIISSSVVESFPESFKMKLPNDENTTLENEIKWNDFINNGRSIARVEENEYTPNSTCSYIHTSGTSNTPKAVDITNENDNQVVRNYYIDNIDLIEGEKAVQTIPHFVEYGKTTDHNSLCHNLCLILIPEMEPKNYFDLINKYAPSYSYATPSHARELVKRNTDMSNVKNYLFGGDGFDDIEPVINKYMKENGSKVPAYQGYGATEFSAVDVINRPGAHKVGSVGKICGENKAIIVEPGTFNIITEPNKIGELCLTGPGLTNGYAGNSKSATEEVFEKGPDGNTYVRMGDYISIDEDGFFYYHGRIKNVITRKSFTFSPEEIVSAIMKHPNVKQCIVIPRYSKEEGETPSAHIVLKDYENKEETLNEIIQLVNDNVQEFHRPTDYRIREKLLITRNNKINVTALKIEDTINMFDGVLNAKIENGNDGKYDYYVNIDFNSNMVEGNNIEEQINDFLYNIANIVKFKPGKIKYNIKYINVSYVDEDSYYKKEDKTYVKHI